MGAWGRPLALRYPALCWSRSNPKPSKWISHTPQSPLSQFFPEGKTNYSYTGSTRATWGSFHKRINPLRERECRHPRTPQSRSGVKPKTLNSLQARVRVFISGARVASVSWSLGSWSLEVLKISTLMQILLLLWVWRTWGDKWMGILVFQGAVRLFKGAM